MEFKAFSFYVEGIVLVSRSADHVQDSKIFRTRGKNKSSAHCRLPSGVWAWWAMLPSSPGSRGRRTSSTSWWRRWRCATRLTSSATSSYSASPKYSRGKGMWYVCKPSLSYIFPASKMFFSQKQISFMSSTEDRSTLMLYSRGQGDINNQFSSK